MLIYVSIYIINVLLSIIQMFYYKNKKVNFCLLSISFVILNLFSCLVYSNGGDWGLYQGMYLKIPSLISLDIQNILKYTKGIEYGINILMALGKIFTNNYEVFKYLLFTFILIYFYRFIQSKARYTLLIISLYFGDTLMMLYFEPILRQLIALVIFLLSFDDLLNKRKIYFFKIFIAYIFHTSAIILFPLYFFKEKKLSKKWMSLMICLIFLFTIFLPKIIVFIINNISAFNVYHYYINSKKFIGKGFGGARLLILTIKIAIYIFPLAYLNKKIKETNKEILLIYNLSFIYLIIYILQQSIEILVRFNVYFGIFYFILVGKAVGKIRLRKEKLRICLLISVYFFLNYYKGIETFKERYIPYTNYIVEMLKNKNYENQWDKIKKNGVMSEVLKWK